MMKKLTTQPNYYDNEQEKFIYKQHQPSKNIWEVQISKLVKRNQHYEQHI